MKYYSFGTITFLIVLYCYLNPFPEYNDPLLVIVHALPSIRPKRPALYPKGVFEQSFPLLCDFTDLKRKFKFSSQCQVLQD